ncbi:MAG: FAD binding domain-containing protein [Chloroflexota bacterium]|jgi:CO/xanthine dehydrogenase FAD-binding subunit|nr:FAD binding domain-containing protein [Chloroflexota bacterium]
MGSYLRPASMDEALSALDALPRTVLAGGTDIYPARVGRVMDDDVLDISGLPDLRTITVADGVCRIPAQATWSDLLRHDLPPAFDGVKAAARAVGGIQIQNRGTICGNVCNASPAGDGMPNLMALAAHVELRSTTSRREVPIDEFVEGNRRTSRRPDELVTGLLIRLPPGEVRSTFRKLGSRAYLVISIAMVAALVELGADGHIMAARIVVGACSEVPLRIPAAEARLLGRVPARGLAAEIQATDLAHLTPIDDVRATAAYRREAALVLVRRAVADLAG